MRDLLYLSENKMRALIPQLPGRHRRRLGFEAGLNAGVATAKATLPSEPQPSSIALLDAVVEMIEQEKGSRWRTDSDLRAGDWIRGGVPLRRRGHSALCAPRPRSRPCAVRTRLLRSHRPRASVRALRLVRACPGPLALRGRGLARQASGVVLHGRAHRLRPHARRNA